MQARSNVQLRSLITAGGHLELSLVDVPVTAPAPNEVVVAIAASPINPSDLGLLLGAADVTTARSTGTADRPVTIADVPQAAMRAMAGRLAASMPVGNEGAGTVVAAGSSAQAQALLGTTVAVLGGAMYTRFRTIDVASCLPLPAGATAADGASSFVNPLTALGMVDTMRAEGHTALVHTAAASNLGAMLNKIALADGVALVNIVRSTEQVALLKGIGAAHAYDSTAPAFMDDLTAALGETKATIAFDAIGGGTLASRILSAMEAAATRDVTAATYSRYGSSLHKQVYIYGGLDTGPTELRRDYGFAWGIGSWLLTSFIAKTPPERVAVLKERVRSELKTTFASTYTRTLSLAEVLDPANIAAFAKRATGEKYLIDPSR